MSKSGQQRHIITIAYWMSPDITEILQELDSLKEKLQLACLTRKKRGNRPILVTGRDNPRKNTDAEATPGLPRNWYRERWLLGLSKIELIKLDVGADKSLPSLVCIHNNFPVVQAQFSIA